MIAGGVVYEVPRMETARNTTAPLAAVALSMLVAACSAAAPQCLAHAERPLALTDLDGREVLAPAPDGPRATVFVFTRSDCPISNRYAPEIRRIAETFEPRGVEVELIYLDRDETAQQIRAHMKEYGYQCGALRDSGHELVALAGATVTPEAAVFTADGCMVYRGRIDDRWVDFGKARAAATRHDLEEALESVLSGRPVERPETKAVGCYIPDLR